MFGTFRHSNFGFVSDFDIRISDLCKNENARDGRAFSILTSGAGG